MKNKIEEDHSRTLKFYIDEEHQGLTLKEILFDQMKLSSRLIRKMKRNKSILVNGHPITFHASLRKGDWVQAIMPEEQNYFEPENIPLDVVYEDLDLMLINKQPGIVVHPTNGHPTGTMANALVYLMKDREEKFKIRFVNRLDMDTSGLIIIAKNPFAQQELSKQMQDNRVQKIYLAVVKGIIEEDHGTIDAPMGRPEGEDIRRRVFEGGQPSVTHYEVVNRLKDATVVRVRLETGRTHQIRVHMAHIGYPLIGDSLYGYVDEELIGRQALHAETLIFTQPRTDEVIEVRAKIPKDIQELISKLSF